MDAAELTLRMVSPDDPLTAKLPDLIRFNYESEFYYDVEARETAGGFSWDLIRRPASPRIRKENKWRPFEAQVSKPRGYVAMIGDEPVGYAESSFDEETKLVRIWHFYVRDTFRRQGIGQALMEGIEQAARHFQARGLILETQTCNMPAIEFYRQSGFEVWGLETAAYTNADIEGREVCLWMGKKYENQPKSGH